MPSLQHPMTRNDDRKGIVPAGLPDRPSDGTGQARNLAISGDTPIFDALHCAPYLATPGGRRRLKGQVEGLEPTTEIGAKLSCGLDEFWSVTISRRLGYTDPDCLDQGAVALDPHRPDWRCEDGN